MCALIMCTALEMLLHQEPFIPVRNTNVVSIELTHCGRNRDSPSCPHLLSFDISHYGSEKLFPATCRANGIGGLDCKFSVDTSPK